MRYAVAAVTVPDHQTLMLSLIRALGDGKPHSVRALREVIAAEHGLTEADRQLLLPSGRQPMFDNRLGWAKTYLAKAGLVTAPRRGQYQLTERGAKVLSTKPARIDHDYLLQFAEFREFYRRGETAGESEVESEADLDASRVTPQEALEAAYQEMRRALEVELLEAVKGSSFDFFERLVVELLVKMGYGGSLKEAGKAIGKSGDDGLDGIIKEDHLGLDAIYVQAKRWSNRVGRPEVQAFAGSLEGVRGRKGVFITTSSYTAEAREYVSRIEKKIVLIDGAQLASLMFDFELGVNRVETYALKRVDTDYFAEE
jgi:restriction system protein